MKEFYLNDKKVPACMIGTWAWGSGMNGSKIVYGKKYDKGVLQATFSQAAKNGFVFWDTAEVYGMGNSEKLLGEFIKGNDNIIMSTKFLPSAKYKEGSMQKSLDKSVSRLGITSPDIYWLHNSNNYEKNLKEITGLQKLGKIKNIGVSNFRYDQIINASKILQQAELKLAAVQNHFSLLHYTDEQKSILNWCNKNDAIYFSYMVLEQGALSGKYDAKNKFPMLSNRNLTFGKKKFVQINPLIELIRNLGQKYSVDSSQVAIIWAISKGTVPIVGLTNPNHVQKLVEGVKVTLSDEDITLLEKTAKETNLVVQCRWEPENLIR